MPEADSQAEEGHSFLDYLVVDMDKAVPIDLRMMKIELNLPYLMSIDFLFNFPELAKAGFT